MLLSLPIELITKILQFLSIKEILNCSTINTKIYEIIQQNSFWNLMNNESTYESIINGLCLMRRFKNAKITVAQNLNISLLDRFKLHACAMDDGSTMIYNSVDSADSIAYQYDSNFNFIRTIKGIRGLDNKKYVTTQGRKVYINNLCTSETYTIHTKLKNREITMSSNYIILYNSKRLSVTNLLTRETVNKTFDNICGIKIFDDSAIIIIKQNKFIMLKYDLIKHKVTYEIFLDNFNENDTTRLRLNYYSGKYVDYSIFTTGHKNDIIFDASTNKLICTTSDFCIAHNDCIINFTQNKMFDIANIIGSRKIMEIFTNSNAVSVCINPYVLTIFNFIIKNTETIEIYKWTI